MKYIESPYFTYVIQKEELQPNKDYLIDFRQITDLRYLPFNYLVIKNLSSIDIEIIIDDNKQSSPLLIPAGSVIIIDNEVFTKIRVRNVDVNTNDKQIRFEAKREVKEKDILLAILHKLGGKIHLNY